MKWRIKKSQFAVMFGFVLVVTNGLTLDAVGWESKHEYTQTGDYSPESIPGTYSGERYLYASAPTIGGAYGEIKQDGRLRAVVRVERPTVHYPASMCDTGWVQVGAGAAQFDTWAQVSAGTATIICWDYSSSYMQQAICPQNQGQ